MSTKDPKDPVDKKEESWALEEDDDQTLEWADRPTKSKDESDTAWTLDDNQSGSTETWDEPNTLGWSTRVNLPQWGVNGIRAHCATDRETSLLHGHFRQVAPGRISLDLGQGELDLPLVDGGSELVIELDLEIRKRTFVVQLELVATQGPPLLLLGRDALAGRFLVDPSRSWTGEKP